MQPPRVLLRRLLNVAVDRNPLDLGDVVEVDGLAEQTQHITTSRPSQGSVLVVGGAVVPFAETGRFRGRFEARGVVNVAEGEDVWGQGGLPGLFGSGEGERAWDELAGGGVGGGGWSVRV